MLLYGVWHGLPMFLLFALVSPSSSLHFVDPNVGIVLACICFPGGAFIAWSEWRRSEERDHATSASDAPENA